MKLGGMFKAILWSLGLGIAFLFLGYIGAVELSSMLTSNSANTMLSSQALLQFGYLNTSKIYEIQSLQMLANAQNLLYLIPISFFATGSIVGYFKGKKEDKEERIEDEKFKIKDLYYEYIADELEIANKERIRKMIEDELKNQQNQAKTWKVFPLLSDILFYPRDFLNILLMPF